MLTVPYSHERCIMGATDVNPMHTKKKIRHR